MRSFAVAGAVSLLCGLVAFAGPSAATESPVVRVQVSGEAQGGVLHVRAMLHEGVTRAVRVYSEPSDTLLAMYVNEDIPEPVHAAWMQKVFSEAMCDDTHLPVVTLPFQPGAEAVVTTKAAPATDSYVRVWIYGAWADEEGVIREQEIPIEVNTNLGSFGFTFARRMVFAPDDGLDIIEDRFIRRRPRSRLVKLDTVCCGLTGDCGGGQACLSNCPQERYCCYKYTGPGCNWCTTNAVICGLTCDTCS